MAVSVYVVDDEVLARERLVYLFNNNFNGDIELLGSSGDADEVLREVPELSPELLFLDIELPGITGLEIAEKLKNEGYKGKIIFVTGYGQYSIKAIKEGAFDYLLKPVDVDELMETVERYTVFKNKKFNEALVKKFNLSKRELEIIDWLSKGLSSEEIAKEMFLSRHTIDTHRRNIHTKTGTKNSVELLNLLRN